MALSLHVYLDKRELPSFDVFSAALVQEKIDLTFSDAFDLSLSPGVVDCTYQGVQTSFQYYFDPAPERFVGSRKISEYDRGVAEFVCNTRDGENAWAASFSAAAVMAVLTNGKLVDQQCGKGAIGKKAIVFLNQSLSGEDELTKRALAMPHVDSEFLHLRKKPWWCLW